jgi:hypothetical protein
MFPPPPVADPAQALQDPAAADLQRLHNWLAVNRPADLAAAAAGETCVDVAIRLLPR